MHLDPALHWHGCRRCIGARFHLGADATGSGGMPDGCNGTRCHLGADATGSGAALARMQMMNLVSGALE